MNLITHDDVVLFDTKEQLKEYIELSGDRDICERQELNGVFPRIHSKHWSFECQLTSSFETKQTALKRLVSYDFFKTRQSSPNNDNKR